MSYSPCRQYRRLPDGLAVRVFRFTQPLPVLGQASRQIGWQVRQYPLTTLRLLLTTFDDPVTTFQWQLILFRAGEGAEDDEEQPLVAKRLG